MTAPTDNHHRLDASCPARDPIDKGRPLFIILHVPKCAGRTIDQHLLRHAPAGTYLAVKKRRGAARWLLPRYDLDGLSNPDRIRAVSGHALGKSMEAIFAGRPIRRTVLLREPLSHIISYYNFRMMRYLSKGWATYDFGLAYKAMPRNFITHFLLNCYLEIPWARLVLMTPEEKHARASAFLATCWFVGDYQRCGELVAAMAPELGVPAEVEARNCRAQWQQRVAWTPLEVDDLPLATRNRIRQENALDFSLWKTWRNACLNTNMAQPTRQGLDDSLSFLGREALRPFHQARRRWQRGWA